MLCISFLGCGRAGRVLGRLWRESGQLELGQVLTRSLDSAREAAEQMGGGEPVAGFRAIAPADIFLVAAPDQFVGDLAARLSGSGLADDRTIAFHLGGAAESAVLRTAGLVGPVASIHPLRSFGDFAQSVADFPGTWCACEGDEAALEVLRPAFDAIGGRTFSIAPGSKLVYHAASVMVSNYVNALVAAGIETYGRAGIDAPTAAEIAAPILRNTLENVIARGPAASLTGPIARGDWQLVARELETLRSLDESLAQVYRVMGLRTLALADGEGLLGPGDRARLQAILEA